MPESTIFDTTDTGTLRPNAKPLFSKGRRYIPMRIEFRYPDIVLPPDASPADPITLWRMYYSLEIMEYLVHCTNSNTRQSHDPTKPHARANDWELTSVGELDTYFAIRIYMMLHVEKEIADYWSTDPDDPKHPIDTHMSRNRFQELHMRFRCETPGKKGPYERVNFSTIFL